ncbi:Vacuolar protein sorting-associated protein 53 [Cladochytrium tenue]|nr:Vacuolar protein sorting-associated protein 53 [Cladochytrium tenue]
MHANVFRCRPISEVGAEQMLLDTHALRTTLLQTAQEAASSSGARGGAAADGGTPASSSVAASPGQAPAPPQQQQRQPPPAAYLKILGRGVQRVEQVLKVVMRPHEPAGGIVETYITLFPDGDAAMLQRILELKTTEISQEVT